MLARIRSVPTASKAAAVFGLLVSFALVVGVLGYRNTWDSDRTLLLRHELGMVGVLPAVLLLGVGLQIWTRPGLGVVSVSLGVAGALMPNSWPEFFVLAAAVCVAGSPLSSGKGLVLSAAALLALPTFGPEGDEPILVSMVHAVAVLLLMVSALAQWPDGRPATRSEAVHRNTETNLW